MGYRSLERMLHMGGHTGGGGPRHTYAESRLGNSCCLSLPHAQLSTTLKAELSESPAKTGHRAA